MWEKTENSRKGTVKRMRILCIGDSNTWGYHPENGLRIERRWTRVLAELLPEAEIIEEGLCGRTMMSMDPVKRERCGMDGLKMILATHKPVDLVIVMLGSNDLKGMFCCTAYSIAKGLCEYIKVINNPYNWEKFPVPKLLVVSPVLLRDEIVEREGIFGEFDENSLMQSKHLAEAMEKACEAYHVEFMDGAAYAEASIADCLHMDEENHEKLGKAICEKIKSMK